MCLKYQKGAKLAENLTENAHEISSRKFRPNLPLFFVGVPNKEEFVERKKEKEHITQANLLFSNLQLNSSLSGTP